MGGADGACRITDWRLSLARSRRSLLSGRHRHHHLSAVRGLVATKSRSHEENFLTSCLRVFVAEKSPKTPELHFAETDPFFPCLCSSAAVKFWGPLFPQ